MLDANSGRKSVLLAVLALLGLQSFVYVGYYRQKNDKGQFGFGDKTVLAGVGGGVDDRELERKIEVLEAENTINLASLSDAQNTIAELKTKLAKPSLGEQSSDEKERDSSDTLNIVTNLSDLDLLDDQVALAGFPTKPVSLKDLALCDVKLNIAMKGHWKCESDPTCVACHTRSIRKYDDLVGILDEPETKSARLAAYEKKFGYGHKAKDRRTLVVSAVNYGQLYLFLNWACSCHKYGMDPREFTIIIPTDEESAKVLRRLNFFIVEPSTWTPKLSGKISAKYTGQANSGPHAQINNVLFIACTEVLVDMGHNILLHDVDIIWKQDIRTFLENASQRRDILGMHAPYMVAKGGVNTGFVYARNTFKSRIFFQTLKIAAALKDVSDQELFNIVLRNRWFSQVEYRILPQEQFYKYSGRSATPPNKARLYHAVGSHKRTSFIYHDLWFFNKSCPYYDGPADEIALEQVTGELSDADMKKKRRK